MRCSSNRSRWGYLYAGCLACGIDALQGPSKHDFWMPHRSFPRSIFFMASGAKPVSPIIAQIRSDPECGEKSPRHPDFRNLESRYAESVPGF